MTTTTLPLVSIVTPSFNQGAYLEETMQSVFRQDYPNIEYLIVDGGSTDASLDIIQRHASRLAWWVSEKDEGQTHAINKGLARAHGKYFMWLCSDDILEPSAIRFAADHLERYPECGCTYGDRARIDPRGNLTSLQTQPEFRYWMLRWWFTLPQETTLIRRSALDAAGGLNPALHMSMDFDLWCRMGRMTRIDHLPTILGRFRSHERNKSSLFSQEMAQPGGGRHFNEYLETYRRHFGPANWKWRMLLFTRLLPFLTAYDRRGSECKTKYIRLQELRYETGF